ncbi:ATP-binding cassette domain-containing protein [Porphyrobacter sp. YT40]|uniref:ABC transporter ATP-binding protein n=1 Tax=Porphyrobacter sp. YT40 TaxID=2547601 RepID=UPI0015E87CD3|nr:ATP-binding cassette domain-containing protein [Porphyrobacter sp. YT40]
MTVEISNITKRFGQHLVLDDVSLSLQEGSILGLVGPNGAGKTTLMRVCAGVVSGGRARVMSADKRSRPARVAALFNNRDLYDHLTGYDNLRLECHLQHRTIDEIGRLSAYLDLGSFLHRKVAVFSLGMRQRLALARALVSTPDLLLLDEPTIGLDPVAKDEIFRLIERLSADGVAIIMSSHDLEDLEQVADTFALLRSGRIVARSDRSAPSGKTGVVIVGTSAPARAASLLTASGYAARQMGKDQIEVRAADDTPRPDRVARLLLEAGVTLHHLTSSDHSLKAFIAAHGGFRG